jgi:hypothetical protein
MNICLDAKQSSVLSEHGAMNTAPFSTSGSEVALLQ